MVRQPADHALERMLYILAALGEMAEKMATDPNPESIVRAILRMAGGAFGIARGALFLYGTASESLVAVGDPVPELRVPSGARRFFVAESGVPLDLVEPHAALHEFFALNADALAGQPRAVWLPLAVNRHFLGVLMLGEKPAREPLSQTELDIITLIGRQLAVALHNHALKRELMEANMQLGLKVRHMEQLFDMSRDLNATLDRGRITRELLLRAVELLDARKGFLLLLGDGLEGLDTAASYGFGDDGAASYSTQDAWLAPAMREAQALRIDGLDLPPGLAATTGLVVPVAYQSRIFGVVAVFDKESGNAVVPFEDDDVPLLVNLAAQAATAIENARLYELATVDGLTRLYIRRHAEQRLAEELKRAQRYDTRVSLMLMDIDHFKRFNDTYGHAMGDEVLRIVARTIRQSVREEVDVAARYGGEELLVLMPETDEAGALAMAERVRVAVEAAVLPQADAHVTISVGVATWPCHGADEEALVAAADKALYRSKKAGRNCTTVAARVGLSR